MRRLVQNCGNISCEKKFCCETTEKKSVSGESCNFAFASEVVFQKPLNFAKVKRWPLPITPLCRGVSHKAHEPDVVPVFIPAVQGGDNLAPSCTPSAKTLGGRNKRHGAVTEKELTKKGEKEGRHYLGSWEIPIMTCATPFRSGTSAKVPHSRPPSNYWAPKWCYSMKNVAW